MPRAHRGCWVRSAHSGAGPPHPPSRRQLCHQLDHVLSAPRPVSPPPAPLPWSPSTSVGFGAFTATPGVGTVLALWPGLGTHAPPQPRPGRVRGAAGSSRGQPPVSPSSCEGGKLSCLGALEQTATGTAPPASRPTGTSWGGSGRGFCGPGGALAAWPAPSAPSSHRLRGPHGVPGLRQRLGGHPRGRVPPELPHPGRGLCESASGEGTATQPPRGCACPGLGVPGPQQGTGR